MHLRWSYGERWNKALLVGWTASISISACSSHQNRGSCVPVGVCSSILWRREVVTTLLSAFWASCLQVISVRIQLQNASCFSISFVLKLFFAIFFSEFQESLGDSWQPTGIEESCFLKNLWNLFLRNCILRVYSFLLLVSGTQSSKHKWHPSNGENLVVLQRCAFVTIFSFYKQLM